MNKRKIINDPVYGFVNINFDIIFDLMEHPYLQRLRRIRQLGLTHYVYPGASHSRFQHALGTTYLMDAAIKLLRSKGIDISLEEEEAVTIAIFLHDIGHGPFSHTLENTIVNGISHEVISYLLMQELNTQFNGRLSLALSIFNNQYHRKFLHELVSSQLDLDRMDYLTRDSFFTGVVEGTVGFDRIIYMLNVFNDKLVVDSKGIYSIEKFLISRRLMYWQVYLHKTVIAADNVLMRILERAKLLSTQGFHVFATPALEYFLRSDINAAKLELMDHPERLNMLTQFISIDDNDIISAIKVWMNSSDGLLSMLSKSFIYRKLNRIEIFDEEIPAMDVMNQKNIFLDKNPTIKDYVDSFVYTGILENKTYNPKTENISILNKKNQLIDVSDASDIFRFNEQFAVSRKYFLSYPKNAITF